MLECCVGNGGAWTPFLRVLPLHPSFGEVTMWVMEVAWAAHLGSPPSASLSQVSLG